MISSEMERRFYYNQIHQWIRDPGFRITHSIHEIIEKARIWNCKLSEYLTIYPGDRGL